MDVEIQIDRDRCIGSGQCVNVAPGVFDQDQQAKAFVRDDRGEPTEKIIHAITSCPMQAIALRVGGVRLNAAALNDWDRGAGVDDPLVDVLGTLCDDHYELRSALDEALGATADASDAETSGAQHERLARVTTLARTHLAEERDAYAAISALIEADLVGSFARGHEQIEEFLADLDGHSTTAADRDHALRELRREVDAHIHLEETLLFPVVLGALWRRKRT